MTSIFVNDKEHEIIVVNEDIGAFYIAYNIYEMEFEEANILGQWLDKNCIENYVYIVSHSSILCGAGRRFQPITSELIQQESFLHRFQIRLHRKDNMTFCLRWFND